MGKNINKGSSKQPGGHEYGYVGMHYMKEIIEDSGMTFSTNVYFDVLCLLCFAMECVCYGFAIECVCCDFAVEVYTDFACCVTLCEQDSKVLHREQLDEVRFEALDYIQEKM